MDNGFKVETSTHILTYYEEYCIIENKEDSEEEPLIVEIKDLSKIQVSTLNSIYPIVEWLVKEIKPKKRKYTKRKKDEKV